MIVSFSWIMKTSWMFTHRKEKVMSRTEKKIITSRKFLLSKEDRLAHERFNVNDSSMIKIKKTMSSSDSRWCLRRIQSIKWCYYMLREISWIISIVCNIVNSICLLLSRRRLFILSKIQIIEKELLSVRFSHMSLVRLSSY